MIIYIAIIICLYLTIIKIYNTYSVREKIQNAIFEYNLSLFDGNVDNWFKSLGNDVIEPFHSSLLRFWDWGCMNVVDRKTYRLIKGYLEE